MTKAIILDTETTNLPHLGGEACEIAFFELEREDFSRTLEENLSLAKVFSKGNLNLQGTFHQTFMPLGEFSPRASEVNGFTKEKLKGSPCISTFEFPLDVTYMIGHNIIFDWQIVTKPDVKLICTKELSIKYLTKQSGRGTKGVNTLTGLIERYYPEEAKELIVNAHSALQDCKLTYLILLKILEVAPELDSFEKLAWQCRQPNLVKEDKTPYLIHKVTEFDQLYPKYKEGQLVLLFGKHKDDSLQAIIKYDKQYLIWIVEKSTMSQDLKDFVKQFLKDNK